MGHLTLNFLKIVHYETDLKWLFFQKQVQDEFLSMRTQNQAIKVLF